ncbi:MAG TPA: ABC transporter substrate-binding protein [Candidatus Binataceae bacterium]|nr:ABC transporter substrate-binding protein [Candidatus Binataceae bacterium]
MPVRLKNWGPELITIGILIAAIAAIELRRAAFHLSPQGQKWTPTDNEGYPRIVRDSSGDTIIMTSAPQRIASETLGSDELLFGVCAGNRLVGVSRVALDDRYSNVAEQVKSLSIPTIETVEQTVELTPDLVFVASYSSAEQVELLRSTGIPVFRLNDFDHISGIIGNIRAVGYAVGEDRCAANLTSRIKKRLNEIAIRTHHDSNAPRVMLYDRSGYTAGANTLFDEMLHTVGARNIAAEHGIQGSTRISAEAIALWQPDFIVAGAAHGEFDQVRQALLSDPAIASSPAGRPGRIIIIDDRYLLCVSQYFVQAVEAMADALYGPSGIRTHE